MKKFSETETRQEFPRYLAFARETLREQGGKHARCVITIEALLDWDEETYTPPGGKPATVAAVSTSMIHSTGGNSPISTM